MNAHKLLDEFGAKLRQVIEESPARDVERNARAALTGLFARMDLVTREEFDVQREVLARTRERLAELERRLAALEPPGGGTAGPRE